MKQLSLVLALYFVLLSAACGSYNNNMGGAGSPVVMTLAPNATPAGGQAFTLTVTGSHFGTDSVVYWNGAPQASTYATGSSVSAQITAADIMQSGMVPVYVRSGGKNSNTIDFTVQ